MIRRLIPAFIILTIALIMPVATRSDLLPFAGLIPTDIQNLSTGGSQSALEFVAPALAIVVLGFVLIVRREQKKESGIHSGSGLRRAQGCSIWGVRQLFLCR